MRTSSATLALLLTACGASESPVASAEPQDRIECAIGGAASFTNACAIERGQATLVLRHVDGGFRRLDVADDRTLTVADGSETVVGTPLADGRLQIAIGIDRYRLPAGE